MNSSLAKIHEYFPFTIPNYLVRRQVTPIAPLLPPPHTQTLPPQPPPPINLPVLCHKICKTLYPSYLTDQPYKMDLDFGDCFEEEKEKKKKKTAFTAVTQGWLKYLGSFQKKLENCVCKTQVMPPCPKPVLTP